MTADTEVKETVLYNEGKIKLVSVGESYRIEIGQQNYSVSGEVLDDLSKIPLRTAESRLEKRLPGVVSALITAGESEERLLLGLTRVRLEEVRTEEQDREWADARAKGMA